MSDKYRTVLSKEDFSPDELPLVQELAGYNPDADDTKAEMDRCLYDYLLFQNNYVCAEKKVRTDLEILDMNYRIRYDHRMIRNLDGRIKSVKSTYAKLKKRKIPLTLEGASRLTDIAGLRVICPYIDDIYTIKDSLLAQENVTLLRCSDYIKNPKPSGYRSLHLIVLTSLYLGASSVNVPVEIQLRTSAMDFWAGLEHKLKYKNPQGVSEEISRQLCECADVIAETDNKMQEIYHSLFGEKSSD